VWRNGGVGLPLTQVNLQRALAQIPAGSMVQPTHFTGVSDPSLLPGSAPGDIDMPGPATPCTLTTLVPPRKARRKTTCVLLPTGRAPLDVVLEVLTMSGIVGAHLAAELNVPPVTLSRLRHDCIGDDGFVFLADGDQQATQSALLWGLCDIAAKAPPVRDVPLPGWLSWATWCYLTGSKPPAHWPFTVEQVQGLARACASYLTTYKSPLVLVRFLSGLSSGDFAQSLGLSRQRLNLIEGRGPTENALTANYLRTAVALHLQHLSSDSFWGAHGCRIILPTETL
jgi:DNA-binding XRE family transcriptional regulator